jgi:hypothetical protein
MNKMSIYTMMQCLDEILLNANRPFVPLDLVAMEPSVLSMRTVGHGSVIAHQDTQDHYARGRSVQPIHVAMVVLVLEATPDRDFFVFVLSVGEVLSVKTVIYKTLFGSNLYNNLAKPLCTVCAVSISSQTSGPRPPKFLQADSKLNVKGRRHKKKFEK